MATVLDQTVLDTAREYLKTLRQNGVQFESAWLFGSFARGHGDENSDIDIALVMKDVPARFFKEVELVKYRRKIDSRIEPHILASDELDSPFGAEIVRTGIKLA